jgi:uncharacterized linocin/CFP29 family protein
MDNNRNSQVGWTDAQWNRVQQAVTEEWQRVRVAGSFLPPYDGLPPSTQVVPSEVVDVGGQVNDSAVAPMLELSAQFTLSGQQVGEDDLGSAILAFKRAATALALDEDTAIFEGQQQRPATGVARARAMPGGLPNRFPGVRWEGGEKILGASVLGTLAAPFQAEINTLKTNTTGLFQAYTVTLAVPPEQLPPFVLNNPGALGLLYSAASAQTIRIGQTTWATDLVTGITAAIAGLDQLGYSSPFVCALSKDPFVRANEPAPRTQIRPVEQIEPLLGRPLVRAPALDAAFVGQPQYNGSGVVLSLAGDAVDLAVAVGGNAGFVQIDLNGKYVFRVYERFALRVKDPNAIVHLVFTP